MAKERPLSIPVILGLKGKGLDEAIRDTKRLGTQLGRLSDTAIKAAAGFAAFKGGQLVANFARDAVEAGRDLQVNLNGLQSVFGELTPTMFEFTKEAQNFGMSMAEAAKASTFIGSVLKQSGFEMEQVTVLTQRLVRAGADLALTYGYDVQEALLAITALFRGEYDPIEKFGVAMKQNEIEGEKARLGFEGLTGAAERLVDQQIRVNFFFERASDAIGAYERQQGTLRVSQDILRASFKNMQQTLGVTLLPTIAQLTASLIPLVQTMGPVLAAALERAIPLLTSFTTNSESITKAIIEIIKTISVAAVVVINMAQALLGLATWVGENIRLVTALATVLVGLRVGIAGIVGITTTMKALGIVTKFTKTQITLLKLAFLGIPFVGIAVGFSMIADVVAGISAKAAEAGDDITDALTLEDILGDVKASTAEIEAAFADIGATADEALGGGAGGEAAKDYVGEFYKKLVDESKKQQAKLQLTQLGASEGLIQAILGSGEGWQKVFDDVVARGIAGVQDVQKLFRATAAGFDEAMQQWEEEYGEPFRQFKEDALAARDALIEFTREIEILPSVAETLGQFERDAVENLASIEEKLQKAFENGQLLDGSYQNLLQYARDEFAVLRQIERQRDEIIGRRNAAEALINSVQQSIQSGARLVGILGKVQTEAEGVDVVEFANRTVSAGTSLKEFRTALLYNFVEPIEKAKSRADELVTGYRAVVERTREFVDNLKALRALGLDPMLFNQLVEAGVEAGGETAKALVEGGSDTVNEVNSLFQELDALGMELGENTAQVMYGQGENFVNGIVEGLTAQAGELEISAQSIAEAFTTTFEQVLVDGINAAIDAAEAAMARMPRIEDFVGDLSFGAPTGGGGGGGGGAAAAQAITDAMVRRSEAIDPSLYQSTAAQINAAAQRARENLAAMGPVGFDRPAPTVGISGTQVSRGNVVYNVYTQQSAREFQNAVADLNAKTGSSRATTSVRSLSDFSVG